MKRHIFKKLCLSTLAALMLLLFTAGSAFAEVSPPSLEDTGVPPVHITFSRDDVAPGQTVDVTVTLDNNTASELLDVTLDTALPQGLTVAKDSPSKAYEAIASGQSVSYTFTAKAAADTAAGTAGKSGNPGTGTPAGSALTAAAILTLLLLSAVLYKRRFSGRRTLSILLCVLLSVEAFALAYPAKALAAGAEPTAVDMTYTAEGSLNLSGAPAVLTSTVHVGQTRDGELPTVTVTSEDTVATGASVCHFVLTASQGTFSKDFDSLTAGASHVTLAGSFEGMTVSALSRNEGNQSITVALTGTVQDNGPGVVLFDDTTIEDIGINLSAQVSTGVPMPAFDVDQCSAQDGSLSLAFSLDRAEFSDKAAASDFSFADAGGTPIEGLSFTSLTKDGSNGTVTLQIAGLSTASELFSAIDEGTMTIGENATNCGPLNLCFDLRDSSATVSTTLTNYSLTENGDGTSTLTGSYVAVVSVSDGTVANLETSDLEINDGDGLPDLFTLKNVTADGNGPDFSFDMSVQVDTEEGITAEDYQEVLYDLPYLLDVTILNGKLTDAHGVVLPQNTFDLMPAGPMAAEANSLDGDASNGLSASDAFSYSQAVLSALGNAASGNYMGAIADLLGIGAGGDASVLEKLNALNKQNSDLQSKVEELSTQIASMQKSLEASQRLLRFYDTSESLSTIVNAVDNTREGSLLTKLSGLKKGTPEYETYVGKIINTITKRTSDKGFNDFLNWTKTLGKMILGENITLGTPVFDDFDFLCNNRCNWDPETFADKQNFRASVISKYSDAYTICMIYMDDYNSKNPEETTYDNDVQELGKQVKDVKEFAEGRAHEVVAREDGKILNLVNGKAYGQNTFSDFNISQYMDPVDPFWGNYKYAESVDSKNFEYDTTDLGNPQDTSSAFSTMVSRLPNTGYDNLYEEFKHAGFKNIGSQYLYFGNYKRTKHPDRLGLILLHEFTGNYYDLKKGEYIQNGSTGYYRIVFYAFKGWQVSAEHFENLLRFNPNYNPPQ